MGTHWPSPGRADSQFGRYTVGCRPGALATKLQAQKASLEPRLGKIVSCMLAGPRWAPAVYQPPWSTDGTFGQFWGPGNLELFILTPPPAEPKRRISDEQLFAIAFAKSAVTTLHSPVRPSHFRAP